MKNLFFFSAVLGSLTMIGCSSAYRTAHTPDDVYFSEGKTPVATAERRSDPRQEDDGYASYWEKQDDDYLRMKVRDRDRWGRIDDIDYWQGYNNSHWVNYNTMWNSPWAMNSWNRWNDPWAWNNPFAWNNPWAMNRPMGWNSGWGWNAGMGFNSWNFGFGGWHNNWNNPWAWNRPVVVINKYPVGTIQSRSTSSLAPYSNYSYNRGNTNLRNRNVVNPGYSRSIWETNSVNQSRSDNSLYRTINRSSGSGGSYDRPARTFDNGSGSRIFSSGSSSGGSSSGGATRSGGSSSSGGGSARGGRGG